jgi:transposase InsO family protein
MLLTLVADAGRFLRLWVRSPAQLAAENLFLRKQLALYQERHVKPTRATNTDRLILVWLSRWFDWRKALAVVKPETFLRWHRQGCRLFWHWKSRAGRPRIPAALQRLIRQMARENPTWGQERIAHDRDSIFSQAPDRRIGNLGLRVLKTPPHCPQANAICERVLGTLRREALDFVIPMTENHLRRMLREWVAHYNHGRPHMSLGPGIPQAPVALPVPLQSSRHRLPAHVRVVTRPILGGLHHEYGLEPIAA